MAKEIEGKGKKTPKKPREGQRRRCDGTLAERVKAAQKRIKILEARGYDKGVFEKGKVLFSLF
jgi:hypothetical protein